MKKIVSFIIVFIFIALNINITNAEYNEDNTIQKAILIETYITKHKIRIKNFINKYGIKDTGNLKNDIKELDESIVALNKIKNSEINSEKSDDIIQAIIKRIKIINENLKQKLYNEKINFQQKLKRKKIIYTKLGIKISSKIDEINIKIYKSIIKNKKITLEKDNKIKNHLIRLNKESKKLKYFGNIDFKSEKEIKDSFVRILTNIKREVNSMKKSMK